MDKNIDINLDMTIQDKGIGILRTITEFFLREKLLLNDREELEEDHLQQLISFRAKMRDLNKLIYGILHRTLVGNVNYCILSCFYFWQSNYKRFYWNIYLTSCSGICLF